MQLRDAISLIENAVPQNSVPQTWADLGAGSGLFSVALISLLPAGSIVHAVDVNDKNNRHYPSSIIFQRADFTKDDLKLTKLDGIVIANALHYVQDQLACIQTLCSYLKAGVGRLILIEYDTNRGNRWVPFPLSFSRAKQIFIEAGFSKFEKIAEHPSIYQNNAIYAATAIY